MSSAAFRFLVWLSIWTGCVFVRDFNPTFTYAQEPHGKLALQPSSVILQQSSDGVVTRSLTEAEEKTLPLDRLGRSLQHRRWMQVQQVGQAGLSPLQFGVFITENPGFNSEFLEAGTNAIRRWTSVVRAFTPATGQEFLIELYLDFGPNYFGIPYSSANTIGFSSIVPDAGQKLDVFTANLQERATSPQQKAILNGLPGQIATDFDGTSALSLTSAGRYAVGFPPFNKFVYAIGFNSNAKFDFNPRDGIDADKLDFEALFTRELGRVLGFLSDVGVRELNPLPRRGEPGVVFFSLPTLLGLVSCATRHNDGNFCTGFAPAAFRW